MAPVATGEATGVSSTSSLQLSPLTDIWEKENADHSAFRKRVQASDCSTGMRLRRAATLKCLKERGALRSRRRPVLCLVGNQNTPDAKPRSAKSGAQSQASSITDGLPESRLPRPVGVLAVQRDHGTPQTPQAVLSPLDRPQAKKAGNPPALAKRIHVLADMKQAAGKTLELAEGSGTASSLLQAVPGGRPFVKLRARRTLNLQAGSESDCQGRKQNRCARSADDIQLDRAHMQQAARSALSRSADWPMACIRKRSEEGTGYELPRKSFKSSADSQSWQAAAASLAKLRLQDKKNRVTFGETTVITD